MSTSAHDPFFEDEEDLARTQAASGKKSTPTAASKAKGASSSGSKPPSFALVVGIAVVALLLGIAIGYFFAMSVVDRSHAASTQPVATSSSNSSMTTAADDETGMPEGHPDIASMMNPDGSVNEEAVEAFKAQRAAQQEGQDVEGGTEAAQDAA